MQLIKIAQGIAGMRIKKKGKEVYMKSEGDVKS